MSNYILLRSVEGKELEVNIDEHETYKEMMDSIIGHTKGDFMFIDYDIECLNINSMLTESDFNVIKATDIKNFDKEAVKFFVDYFGGEFDSQESFITVFEDAYMGEYDSEEDYAQEYMESTGMLDSLPGLLQGYFDYAAFARDIFICDMFYEGGHVFSRI